jgi:hypothetical protein
MRALRHAIHAALAVVLAVAGCATATVSGISTGTGGGGGGGASTGTTTGTHPVYDACSTGMPCSPGKTCVNGLCEKGCNTDADCATDEYCALSSGQVCQPKTLVACPVTPCAPTQVCVDGICATEPTGMPCGPNPFGGDGCQMNALCLGNVTVDGMMMSGSVCYVLPTCSATHPCTPGGEGAICSTGLVQGKNDMCIPNGCATDQNCPTGWKCIPPVGTAGYGHCSDGAAGHLCAKTADCQSGLTCYVPVMSMPGTCK